MDTITIPVAKSHLSDAKLVQLEDARKKALASRREQALQKLHRRVSEMRQKMGGEASNSQLINVVHMMMEKEELLRSKNIALVESLNQWLSRIDHHMAPRGAGSSTRAPSEVGSTVSSSSTVSTQSNLQPTRRY